MCDICHSAAVSVWGGPLSHHSGLHATPSYLIPAALVLILALSWYGLLPASPLLLSLLLLLAGLKRHSVTLFEGGRVGGAAVIDELISELAASAAAGADFEGDMVQVGWHGMCCCSVQRRCSSSCTALSLVLEPLTATTFFALRTACYKVNQLRMSLLPAAATRRSVVWEPNFCC